ncbi:NADAR family protein [Bowmanella denitrificans]|uniref:NADAR family protein n=1 Tax=Bowmanella denitrificans TaxID=366582 RepID=UPI001FEAF3E7|nr:NADAR family protein [Bowmanella denitrificans]
MYEAVLKKFQTHPKLAELLKSTGAQDIVENAPGDYYWGCGQDGTGKNKLGRILARVRDDI